MFSFSDLISALRSIIILAEDVRRHDEDIKAMRKELRDLTLAVYGLAQDMKNYKEQNEQRHENLLLELENRLLKYEKALPPPRRRQPGNVPSADRTDSASDTYPLRPSRFAEGEPNVGPSLL